MKFTAEQFTPTQYSTSADKAKFANHFVRFVTTDFKATMFPKWFYTRLSMCFGHIAHYNQGGFYETFFSNTEDKIAFLRMTIEGGGYGDPAFTYCDVERALSTWLQESKMIENYIMIHVREVEEKERSEFARLKSKYEPANT